jgi:uncharacterized membrane protein HdeD (DUF308 family)
MENVNRMMGYLAYLLGSIFILLGISIMMGSFIPRELPSQFKWMFGIVLFLYGIFRIVYTYYKKRESLHEDDEDT